MNKLTYKINHAISKRIVAKEWYGQGVKDNMAYFKQAQLEQKENTLGKEDVSINNISDQEKLRNTALKMVERGYMNAKEYEKFCRAYHLLVF